MREHDGRNDALLHAIGPIARDIYAVAGGSREQLFDYAMKHNRECAQPMDAKEVGRVTDSVWKMTVEGRNWIGRPGAFMPLDEMAGFRGNSDALYLLAFLRAREGKDLTFWIANGLAETPDFSWSRKRLAAARQSLIELGLIKMIAGPKQGSPALYRWTNPAWSISTSYS